MSKKKYLFICGAPRSGTTALWRLLVSDKRIVLGVERYGNLFFKKNLTKDLFEYDRFSILNNGDTFYSNLESFNPYYKDMENKFLNAEFVGDKIPLLYQCLDGLFEEIPDAKVIFMVRNIFDVAASYEARADNEQDLDWRRDRRTNEAIKDWSLSLRKIRDYGDNENILTIIYEDFYKSESQLERLLRFLGLEASSDLLGQYEFLCKRSLVLEEQRKRALNEESVMKICSEAPFGLYREVLKLSRNSHE